MNPRIRFFQLAGVALLVPTLLNAQQQPVELGIDGGLAISFNGNTSTAFRLPFQSLRAGFFPSDAVSLEPAVAVNYLKIEGIDAIYTLGLELGGLFHFVSDRSRSQPYFRPFAGIQLFASGGESASQFHAGGGFGVKLPVANQLAVRLEAGFQHAFENDDFSGGNSITGAVGLSFFTR
jgi:hypothetical protein